LAISLYAEAALGPREANQTLRLYPFFKYSKEKGYPAVSSMSVTAVKPRGHAPQLTRSR